MDLTTLRTRDPLRLDRSRMITIDKPALSDVYHHGVKGMKWGVRHDRKRLGRRAGSKSEESSTGNTGFQLTDKQKRALKIGAGIAAGVLVAYGGYKLNQMGTFDVLKEKGAAALAVDKPQVDLSRSLASNPHASHGINCGPAGISGVIQRAFGVSAEPYDMSISYAEFRPTVERCFKGCKVVEPFNSSTISSAEKASAFIKKRFSKNGEDADGLLAFPVRDVLSHNNTPLTHNISWQIRNGEVRFYDDGKQLEHDRVVANHFRLVDVNRPFTAVSVTGSQLDKSALSKYVNLEKEVVHG